VRGGDTITLRFAIWDTGDHSSDSTVLLGSFEWIASGSVTLGTAPN
jgi:hypothetical protein